MLTKAALVRGLWLPLVALTSVGCAAITERTENGFGPGAAAEFGGRVKTVKVYGHSTEVPPTDGEVAEAVCRALRAKGYAVERVNSPLSKNKALSASLKPDEAYLEVVFYSDWHTSTETRTTEVVTGRVYDRSGNLVSTVKSPVQKNYYRTVALNNIDASLYVGSQKPAVFSTVINLQQETHDPKAAVTYALEHIPAKRR
jgi:hypothetical protein